MGGASGYSALKGGVVEDIRANPNHLAAGRRLRHQSSNFSRSSVNKTDSELTLVNGNKSSPSSPPKSGFIARRAEAATKRGKAAGGDRSTWIESLRKLSEAAALAASSGILKPMKSTTTATTNAATEGSVSTANAQRSPTSKVLSLNGNSNGGEYEHHSVS